MLREDYGRASALLNRGLPWPQSDEPEPALLAGKRTLLIWGEDDKVTAPFHFRAFQEDLARHGVPVEALALPDCGHLPMLEYPAEVARLLSRFWNARP